MALSWRAPALAALTAALLLAGAAPAAPASLPVQTPPSVSSPVSLDEPSSPPAPVTLEGTLLSTGDLLMHDPILEAAYSKTDNTYDFSRIFTHIAPYVEKADLAVANLEVTLAGDTKYPYRGYPRFNCPDAIVTAAKAAGFDLLLTANNHTNDSGLFGIRRTMEALERMDMSYTGTRKSDRDKRYRVADVGGIPVGLINYTYQAARADGKPSLNLLLEDAAVPLVNSFDYRRLDDFYNELAGELAAMRRDGALATVVYIHWGNEYRTTPNKQQRAIAQKLCDLGVDVIIGGHPHVVQPLEILTAPDGGRTVCLYSMGNAVSNQRIYRASIKTGHTEDGVLFSVTFRRTGDGPVQISGVDVLPTWVNLYRDGDRDVFQIVPGYRQRLAHRLRFGSPRRRPRRYRERRPRQRGKLLRADHGPGAGRPGGLSVCFPGGRLRQDTRRIHLWGTLLWGAMGMIKILIVEDDDSIAGLMRMTLCKNGYHVETAPDGLAAARAVESAAYDLLLLDVMLPGLDGFELMDYLQEYQIPVIFITARAAVADRVKGLRMGADDYIVKPFDLSEFLARVEAVLRRYHKKDRFLCAGSVVIDTESRTVTRDGAEVSLTLKEYEMLLLFVRNPGVALYRETIYERVWDEPYYGDTRTVDLHVQRLRKKLNLSDEIQSVYKIGYRFKADDL